MNTPKDGSAGPMPFGDSGLTVLASALHSLRPVYRPLNRSSALAAAPGQRLQLECAEHCNVTTLAYLAGSCGAAPPTAAGPGVTLPTALVSTGDPDGADGSTSWFLDLDASSLEPGATYQLCADLDGPAGAAFANDITGFEVFVTPILAVKSMAVERLAAQALDLHCPVCNQSVEVYLHADCGEPAPAASGPAGTPRVALAASSSEVVWVATVDASGLTLGTHYRLCMDVTDLRGGYLVRDSGLAVFVGSFGGLTAAIVRPNTDVELQLTCSTPSSCTEAVEAHLATACDAETVVSTEAGLNPDAAAPGRRATGYGALRPAVGSVAGVTTSWVLPLRVGDLEPGRYYRLCTDLDGHSGEGSVHYLDGDSGIVVYMSPADGGDQVSVTFQTEELVMLEACAACSAESRAYLAYDCLPPFADEQPVQGEPIEFIQPLWWVRVRAQPPLHPFERYRICMDTDGLASNASRAVGDTGRGFIYLVGMVGQDHTIAPAPATRFEFACEGCSNETLFRLADFCVPTFVAGFSGAAGLDGTAAAGLEADGSAWAVTLDTSALRPGGTFRVCTDGDGPGPLAEGDAGWSVYVSPVQLQTKVLAAGARRRELRLRCVPAGGCTGLSSVRLALDCKEGPPYLAAAAPFDPIDEDDGLWAARVFTAGLTAGQAYRVCTDLDGDSADLATGDSGEVYLSPVASVTQSSARPLQSPGAPLTLTCAAGVGCSSATRGYLSTACDSNATANGTEPSSLAAAPGGGGAWLLALDLSPLLVGVHYELCVDLDGHPASGPDLPLGGTGMRLFTTAAAAVTPTTIEAAPGQALALACDGPCQVLAGYLAESCDAALGADMRIAAFVRTAAAAAVPDDAASSAALALDATRLRPGRHFQLCLDHGQGFGDSGLQVYVSGVVGLAPSQLRAGAGQALDFTCLLCEGEPGESPVRLAGDSGYAGRLEVFHDGAWGTVCGDNFTDVDAHVVCRQLRHLGGTAAVDGGAAGAGSIWLDEVGCHGDELELSQCPSAGWGQHDCDHSRDVSVTCLPTVVSPTACCTWRSRAFLARADEGCGAPAGNSDSTEVVRPAGAGTKWSVTLDTSLLRVGAHYLMCIDTDGTYGALGHEAVLSLL